MTKNISKRDRELKQMLDNLSKASRTIHNWLKEKSRNKSFKILLPHNTDAMISGVMGRNFLSHTITSNSLIHALRNHGENGLKLNDNSIPLNNEYLELIPYILTAPDSVYRGSMDLIGRESVKFFKNLSNGTAIVVEKEYKNSPDDLETITMWAVKSSGARNARLSSSLLETSETAIPDTDIAKIRKDAEKAIENDVNFRYNFNLDVEEEEDIDNDKVEKKAMAVNALETISLRKKIDGNYYISAQLQNGQETSEKKISSDDIREYVSETSKVSFTLKKQLAAKYLSDEIYSLKAVKEQKNNIGMKI